MPRREPDTPEGAKEEPRPVRYAQTTMHAPPAIAARNYRHQIELFVGSVPRRSFLLAPGARYRRGPATGCYGTPAAPEAEGATEKKKLVSSRLRGLEF